MRTIKIFILFAITIFIFSCNKDDQTDIPDQSDIDTGIEKRQAVIGNWTPPPCIDLTIFIDGTCGPNWAGSLAPAITAYNAVPDVAINMVQVFSEPADIVITCVDFANANSFGLGAWPDTDGEIQGQIFLNTDFENCGGSACFFQGAIMHEISHNLGFGHGNSQGGIGAVGSWTFDPATGTFTQDNTGATLPLIHVDGTPQFNGDPQSIFNPHLCTDNICTFTNADIVAMQDIYPACGCPQFVDDICDCPVTDICDCPELVEDPCDCPDLFPDEVEFICYCVCYVLSPKVETTDFELHYVENSRIEIDCDQAASASCTEFNNKSSYCERERECAEIPIVIEEEGEKCYCKCTITSSIGQEEPLSWKQEVDCDKPEDCDNAPPGAECEFIRE